jgi:hypothetical protein
LDQSEAKRAVGAGNRAALMRGGAAAANGIAPQTESRSKKTVRIRFTLDAAAGPVVIIAAEPASVFGRPLHETFRVKDADERLPA